MKSIVIYCSKSNKTEKIAKEISKKYDCDILKVEPVVPYGNYLSAVIRVGKEKIFKDNVDYKTKVPNLDSYEKVFIGYPIWYNELPNFMQNFLSKCDFSNKEIIPFSTSGGSHINVTMPCLKRVLDNNSKNYQIGKVINNSVLQKDDI